MSTTVIDNLDKYQVLTTLDHVFYELSQGKLYTESGYFKLAPIRSCLIVGIKHIFEKQVTHCIVTMACLQMYDNETNFNNKIDENKKDKRPMYFIRITRENNGTYTVIH